MFFKSAARQPSADSLSFRLTNESMTHPSGVTLRRIQATRDIPEIGVSAGDLGGWVESVLVDGTPRLSGQGWVFDNGQVYGNGRVSDRGMVRDNAQVFGNGHVAGGGWVFEHGQLYDDGVVYGEARVHGNSRVHGRARVSGGGRVFGFAVVFGDAIISGQVCGTSWVSGDAQILYSARVHGAGRVDSSADVLVIAPVGSSNNTVTLFRSSNGHGLYVGCWAGTIESLMPEVERRRKHWTGSRAEQAAWLQQYRDLYADGKALISTWERKASHRPAAA
jgi:hypothetical protein